jgi:hypothetical protein
MEARIRLTLNLTPGEGALLEAARTAARKDLERDKASGDFWQGDYAARWQLERTTSTRAAYAHHVLLEAVRKLAEKVTPKKRARAARATASSRRRRGGK